MIESLPKGMSGRTARQIAIQAAREAGGIIGKYFGVAKTVGVKSRGNIVTQADLLSEHAIVGLLRTEFPDHGILAEESPEVAAHSRYLWVIDPLDGTLNFSSHIPFFAVSIALTLAEEPVLGVVYDPLRRELFVAERGKGALLNGRPIHVGETNSFDSAVVGFDLGYDESARAQSLATATVLRPATQTLRVVGSAVLGQSYVACGRFDLYYHAAIYPWDVAAAQVLLREAGGVITDWHESPATIRKPDFVAGNAALHRAFFGLVQSVSSSGR